MFAPLTHFRILPACIPRACLRLQSVLAAALFIALLQFFPAVYAEITYHIVIVTSAESSYQTRIANSIRENLEADGARSVIVSAEDIGSTHRNGKTLYIAIGEQAVESLDKFDSNAIMLRIRNKAVPGTRYNSAQSDLITAQPACRHIKLVKAINSKWHSIGVLSSVESLETAAALTRCAIRHNINLQVYAITDKSDLMVTLEAAVKNNKALLAIPDPLVYNSYTVKNILLTAYRHRKPVIGFSESFVQAGAVAAAFTPPEGIGDKAFDIIARFFGNNWQFDRKIYNTDDFSIATNKQVATSLDIKLPDPEAIRAAVMKMERDR